jgi:type VI secretion system protein ImpM
MPRECLTTGFFGKVPTADDFVSWNLPKDFTDRWGRWMSMELAARPGEGDFESRAWRFSVCGGIFGERAASGVWRMSRDRLGRRFPFVVAGLGTPPDPADAWFDGITAVVDGMVTRFETQHRATRQIGRLQPASAREADRICFWLDDWEVVEVTFADIHDLAANGLPTIRAARSAAG